MSAPYLRRAMLQHIIQFFRGGPASLLADAEGAPSDEDLQIAVGVALLEIAGSDTDFAPEETEAIFHVLEHQFSIHSEQVTQLLEVADIIRKDPERLDSYYQILGSRFTNAQKQKVFAMIWKVVLADGRVDRFEMKLATQLRFRLQLTDRELEAAKALVEAGHV